MTALAPIRPWHGVFEPLWRESPGNFRTHGLENLTVVWVGLLVGILAAAVIRSVTDGRAPATEEAVPAEPEASAGTA